jgi:5-formyltetrahydrofolate cyclo-ligase
LEFVLNKRVEIQQKKSQSRSDLLRAISRLTPGQKSAVSQQLQSHLRELLKNEKGLWGAYRNLNSEPALNWAEVSDQIQWAFPAVTGQQQMQFRASPGRFKFSDLKIEEPVDGLPISAEQLNGVVMPGLGFDSQGHRLGRGGGYYDRYFGGQPEIKKIGVCFSFAFSESLPHEEHDIVCDWVVTEKQCVATGQVRID